jgi:hypothetical protein
MDPDYHMGAERPQRSELTDYSSLLDPDYHMGAERPQRSEAMMKVAVGVSVPHTVDTRPFLQVLVIHNYDIA